MRGYHNAVKILSVLEKKLVAPCGLYCGACIDYLVYKNCHGCGCECGKCAASRHHKQCDIYKCCLEQKGLSACSECQELPCARLIRFCYNPVWLHHLANHRKLAKTQSHRNRKVAERTKGNLEKWMVPSKMALVPKRCENRLQNGP